MPEHASAPLARGMIGLLGPVEFRAVAVPARSLAVLLALLAWESGHAVSMARIVAELWGDDPPPSAIATVHAYVSRLRVRLRPHATVAGTAAGYTLRTEDGTDAAVFAHLVDTGYGALDAGAAADARDAFEKALALWRGDPFGGVGGAVLAAAAGRMTSLRRDARIGLVRAALGTGDVRRATGLAEALVGESPLDESAWETLILALDAAERPAAAIEAYAACRRQLAAELGTEPGARLRDLHVRLLRGERVGPTDAAPAGAAPGGAVPGGSGAPDGSVMPGTRGAAGSRGIPGTRDAATGDGPSVAASPPAAGLSGAAGTRGTPPEAESDAPARGVDPLPVDPAPTEPDSVASPAPDATASAPSASVPPASARASAPVLAESASFGSAGPGPALSTPGPASAPARPGFPPPIDDPALPGRSEERRALAAAVAQLASGGSPVVLVSGEAGIGKTTLLDFATRAARAAGCRVVPLRALAGLTTPPFWIWSEALRRLGARMPEDQTSEASAAERFRRIEAIAQTWEAAIADAPTLLVVDDVQWCDAASLDALRVVLARGAEGFGVVLAARDHDATDAGALRQTLAALRRETGMAVLHPRPLGIDDVERLADAVPAGPGAARADEIVARSGGNPFLVHELLRAGGDALPASAVDSVAARLAPLSAETIAVLRLAAAAGTDIDLDLVAAAHGVSGMRLGELLHPAVEAGLVRGGEGRSRRFLHDLLREAIIELTPPAERYRSHARLAEALEETVVEDPDRIAELAHHRYAAAAGATSLPAADALLRAADHAASRLGYEQAALQRQRALQSMPTGPSTVARRLAALQRLAEERRLIGDPVGADQAIARALTLARDGGDRARIAQIVGAPTLWNWRSYGAVEPRMIALLDELLAQATDPADRARLGGALAVELAYDARGDRRAAISEAAVSAARSTGDDAVLGRALNNFAISNWQPARREVRAAALDEALSLRALPPETEAIARLHRAAPDRQ